MKKSNITLISVLILLLFTSCKKNSEKMVFWGNINNKVNGKIELIKNINEVTGQFLNLENDSKLELKGTIIDDNLIFNEFQKNNKISGTFEGKIKEDTYEGYWFNRAKTVKVPFTFRQKSTTIREKAKEEPKDDIKVKNQTKKMILEDIFNYNSHLEIRQKYGNNNNDVIQTIETLYEDIYEYEQKFTVIYPNSNNEIKVVFNDEGNKIEYIKVSNVNSNLWKSKTGIILGMNFKDLEKINEKAFLVKFIMGDCSYEQISYDWKKGKLSKFEFKIETSQDLVDLKYGLSNSINCYSPNVTFKSNEKEFKNVRIKSIILYR
ncbi:hypothetical protein [Tenacibaculum finnmarkense]|uniref:hypothetical protein n=1 Tax=Tenacibaculum finnmarkense TaxID=2781243 RepID=UPI001E540E12|nr:hypothetical protein [Tenacibaculum finnmarkense]MCD8423576.1 hypothetical protein [Tenacibaculum finnmarkense genomovar ulcerans]MCG8239747.1 hypothetical protein [Tenacibaculum finnmarkense genomovar ulcerans]